MASIGMLMNLVAMAILMAGSLDRATAQSGCTATLTSMAPCLPFITGNSSTPSPSCCAALASVVQSSPRCLCSALNGGALPSLGININQTQAVRLPGSCNVQTPPVSQCNAASGPTASAASPVGAPVGAPAESTSNTPEAAAGAATPSASTTPSGTTPADGGSKATPSPPVPVAGGSSVKLSLQFVILLLFVASYSSVAKRVASNYSLISLSTRLN